MNNKQTVCFLICKRHPDINVEVLLEGKFLIVKPSEHGKSIKIEVVLGHFGSASVIILSTETQYKGTTISQYLSAHAKSSSPISASEWVINAIEQSPCVIEISSVAEDSASQEALEDLKHTLWDAFGGIWYFENEWFTNESGAAVLFKAMTGVAGRIVVATLYKGAWVEYSLYGSNPAYMARFLNGQLPSDMVERAGR